MRDPIDLIHTDVWYWKVREVSGLNDYQLDLACFADGAKARGRGSGAQRVRIFERVRLKGTAPDRRDVRRKFILIDVVERHFPGTRYCFDHVLWELLTPPAPSLARVQAIIKTLLPLTGFCRCSYDYALTLRNNFLRKNQLVEPNSRWSYESNKNGLDKLSSSDGYDQLALLTCLALETRAYLGHEDMMLEMMESFVHDVEYCELAFGNFATRPEIIPVRDELWKLYKARIFSNRWDVKAARRHTDGGRIVGALDTLLPLNLYGEDYEFLKKISHNFQREDSSDVPQYISRKLPWEMD